MELFDFYKLKITTIEPLLGTVASDKAVYARFIATKAPVVDPDETHPDEGREEAGWTTFFRMPDENGQPIMEQPVLMDYQIKGMFKEIANITKENTGVKAARSKIDNDLFIKPRRTPLPSINPTPLERPLRAMTPQGPRVSVVRSDLIDPGATFEVILKVRKKSQITEEVLRAILSYGEDLGLGQWRNAGYGRFEFELEAQKYEDVEMPS